MGAINLKKTIKAIQDVNDPDLRVVLLDSTGGKTGRSMIKIYSKSEVTDEDYDEVATELTKLFTAFLNETSTVRVHVTDVANTRKIPLKKLNSLNSFKPKGNSMYFTRKD